jgi:hypothetical protein
MMTRGLATPKFSFLSSGVRQRALERLAVGQLLLAQRADQRLGRGDAAVGLQERGFQVLV